MMTRVGAYKPNGLDHRSGLHVGMMSLDCYKTVHINRIQRIHLYFFPPWLSNLYYYYAVALP